MTQPSTPGSSSARASGTPIDNTSRSTIPIAHTVRIAPPRNRTAAWCSAKGGNGAILGPRPFTVKQTRSATTLPGRALNFAEDAPRETDEKADRAGDEDAEERTLV